MPIEILQIGLHTAVVFSITSAIHVDFEYAKEYNIQIKLKMTTWQ